MPNTLTQASVFLISAIFELYLSVLALRLILAYTQANYFNPITQMIVKLTQPIVAPLRRVVPTYRRIEWATLIWILIIETIKIFLLVALLEATPALVTSLLFSVTETLKLILNIFFYAILLQVILSWIQPGHSPVNQVLEQITSPIMRPLHRLIPPIGGFAITPIQALVLLRFLIIAIP